MATGSRRPLRGRLPPYGYARLNIATRAAAFNVKSDTFPSMSWWYA